MIKRRMVIALSVAVVSSTITFVYLVRTGDSEGIVVASIDIPACTLITSQAVRLVEVNKQAAHPAAYRRLEEVVGRYSTQALVAGEQVLKHRIAAGEHGGVVSGVAGDLRVVLIPVDESRAVGGLIKAGDLVDVIFVSEEQRSTPVAKCVLRSLPVIRSGFGGRRDDRLSSLATDGGAVPGVVVAVTPGDAEKLAFCLENGRIYLVAAPHGASPSPSQGVTWKDVLTPDASVLP